MNPLSRRLTSFRVPVKHECGLLLLFLYLWHISDTVRNRCLNEIVAVLLQNTFHINLSAVICRHGCQIYMSVDLYIYEFKESSLIDHMLCNVSCIVYMLSIQFVQFIHHYIHYYMKGIISTNTKTGKSVILSGLKNTQTRWSCEKSASPRDRGLFVQQKCRLSLTRAI